MFGNYFITLAVTRLVVGSSVCTYKRCKTCELIRETSESNEPMFMVTKKAVSQLGNACDIMLRNDSQKNRHLAPFDSGNNRYVGNYPESCESSKKHCCDNFLYDSRSMFASQEENNDPTSINDTFGLIYMAVTALVILSLVIG